MPSLRIASRDSAAQVSVISFSNTDAPCFEIAFQVSGVRLEMSATSGWLATAPKIQRTSAVRSAGDADSTRPPDRRSEYSPATEKLLASSRAAAETAFAGCIGFPLVARPPGFGVIAPGHGRNG